MSFSSVFNLIRKASYKKSPSPPPATKEEIVEVSYKTEIEETSQSRAAQIRPLADSPISSGCSSANDSDFESSISSEEDFSELTGEFKKAQPQQATNSVGLTFDAFIAKIDHKNEDSISTDTTNSIEKRPKKTENYKKAEIEQLRQLALEKERKIEKRKKSAVRIQAWFRGIRGRKRYKILKENWIREERERKLAKICDKIKRKTAALKITRAIREFSQRNIQMKEEIMNKFKQHCAGIIQQAWRSYKRNKANIIMQKVKKEKLKGIVKGWKLRRILKTPDIALLIEQIKTSTENLVLKQDLISSVALAFASPSWGIHKKAAPKPFLRKSVTNSKTRQPLQRGKLSLNSKQSIRSQRTPAIQNPISFPLEETSHYESSAEESSVNPVSSKDPTISEVKFLSPPPSSHSNLILAKPPKPFLRRRSERVNMQKINWNTVESKLDCWIDPKKAESKAEDTQSNTGRSERGTSIQPPSRSNSNISRHSRNSSLNISKSPIVIVEAIRKNSFDDFLLVENKVKQSCKLLFKAKTRVRTKPDKVKRKNMKLAELEEQYEKDMSGFKKHSPQTLEDSKIPIIYSESIFLQCVSVQSELKRLKEEYNLLCDSY
ncbi:unnamed protein product [Blepharisma stoltei]|uniref:Uncharacterized protein n=1 Tax=Blepharisma stoltei TaxID=1481888 RepID=A0AAU9ICQ5_9CILI|nr:unnamed protein product [Blepharisma stoltei]